MGEVNYSEPKSELYLAIQELKSISPFLLLCIYTIGYIYTKFFYLGLGVTIEYYIDLVDIIFITINQLLKTFALYFLIDFLFFLGFKNFEWMLVRKFFKSGKFKNKERVKLFLLKKRFYYKEIYYSFVIRVFLIILILQLFILFVPILEFPHFPTTLQLLPIILIKTVSVVLELDQKKNNSQKISDGDKFYIYLIIGFIILVVSSFFLAVVESKRILNRESSIKLKFEVENNQISTFDNVHIYIGETSRYIFIYHKPTKKTISFNKSDISKIEFYK
jgi:hypothetical protein